MTVAITYILRELLLNIAQLSTARWKALDEIYEIYMLLHRSDLNIAAKIRHFFVFSKLEMLNTLHFSKIRRDFR